MRILGCMLAGLVIVGVLAAFEPKDPEPGAVTSPNGRYCFISYPTVRSAGSRLNGIAYAIEAGGAMRELWRMALGSNLVLFLADDGGHLAMLEPHEWGITYSSDPDDGFQERENHALVFIEKGNPLKAYKASELFDGAVSWAKPPNDVWWVCRKGERLPRQTSGFRFEVETPDGVTHEFDLRTGERRSHGSEKERLRNRMVVGRLFSALHCYAQATAGISVVLGPFKFRSAGLSGDEPGVCEDIGVYRGPKTISAGVVRSAPSVLIKVWHHADHARYAGLTAAAFIESGVTEYWDIDTDTGDVRVFVRTKGGKEPVSTIVRGSKFVSETLPGFELRGDTVLEEAETIAR